MRNLRNVFFGLAARRTRDRIGAEVLRAFPRKRGSGRIGAGWHHQVRVG